MHKLDGGIRSEPVLALFIAELQVRVRHGKLQLKPTLLLKIGIKQSVNRLHETTDDRSTWTQHTVGLAPNRPDILSEAVRAWMKNKIEGAVFKTRQIGHVALNSLKRKAIAISHHPIL